MHYQKTVGGLFFLLLLSIGAFAVVHFSFLESVKVRIFNFFPVIEDYFENKENGFVQNGIWSPGPLIKEKEDQAEVLTREGIIEETNSERERLAREPLLANNLLNDIADIKLEDMFEDQYFAHISPDGVGVGDIATDLYYEYITIGDNLALGNFRGDSDVVREWMNSPGHRKNILNKSYQEIGVATGRGEYDGNDVWMAVQVFAMPSSACPEIEESVKNRLDNKKAQAQKLEEERKELEKEMDAIEDRGGEEYIKKVEEYNQIVRDYNELIPELDSIIDEYNQQVKEREDCITKANESS